jgi:phosphate:Na+ symporter
MFHTLFNVVTVIAVLPFTNLLVKGVSKILPQKAQEKAIAPRLYFVDEHMLKTPPVAVGQVKNEIINMAGIAQKNFMSACKMVCSLDLSEGESFFKNEEQLNFINDNLSAFIVKLLKSPLSERDRQYLSSAFHAINHLERVGDYARNIVEYAQKLKGEGKSFSPAAVGEIERVAQVIQSLYTQVLKVYVDGDGRAYAQACALEDEVDALTKSMGKQHINRLNQGICPPEVGAKYLALACDTERVADHYINLARTAKGK